MYLPFRIEIDELFRDSFSLTPQSKSNDVALHFALTVENKGYLLDIIGAAKTDASSSLCTSQNNVVYAVFILFACLLFYTLDKQFLAVVFFFLWSFFIVCCKGRKVSWSERGGRIPMMSAICCQLIARHLLELLNCSTACKDRKTSESRSKFHFPGLCLFGWL